MAQDLLQQIRSDLKRIGATQTQVSLDAEYEPKAGELVWVKQESAEWRLLPAEFEELLKNLPAGAGDEGVKRAIESKGSTVWHGPSPDSRDTSP
jgi:diadenosine tetraphosphatase ApaH/serine/threonine PP2A family protein phosphatase